MKTWHISFRIFAKIMLVTKAIICFKVYDIWIKSHVMLLARLLSNCVATLKAFKLPNVFCNPIHRNYIIMMQKFVKVFKSLRHAILKFVTKEFKKPTWKLLIVWLWEINWCGIAKMERLRKNSPFLRKILQIYLVKLVAVIAYQSILNNISWV